MTNLKKLREYESSGDYVFHGSGDEIEEFEPRQAHNYINGEKIPDGEPAVFASDVLDYAIFRALINRTNFPEGYHAGVSNKGTDKLYFSASKETINKLDKKFSGFVYVFPKSKFRQKSINEHVSFDKIKPVEKIKVYFKDFNQPIEIKKQKTGE